MDRLFQTLLNMSLTGSFVIVAVMLARLALKKAPKLISYCLWAVVWFRLACPFTVESAASLIPFQPEPVQSTWIGAKYSYEEYINAPQGSIDPSEVRYYDAPADSVIVALGSYIWPLGVCAMLIYSAVSIIKLKRGLRFSAHAEGNIYEAENLKTPFVIGVLRPRIYIPAGLCGEERRYIVLHERTHIRRCDHIIKMLTFFILCLHWFNPLVWAAFALMVADMEMSCDERVMRELGGDIKNAYSLSLVRVAAGSKILNGSPLAFGEGGMRQRVKNVLNFKKPSRVIIILSVALAAILSVGFALNRSETSRQSFEIPYFEAGGLELGAYAEDMDLSLWDRHDGVEWDYTNPYGAIRLNGDGRIDKFTVNVYAFTEGIWTMSGIQPKEWYVNNYTFNVPTTVDEVIERFGAASERYDAPENSKDTFSYLLYEDKQSGIKVGVDFFRGSGQIAYVRAEGLPEEASRPTPAPTAAPVTIAPDSAVTIVIWKNEQETTRYSLFDGDVSPEPSEFESGRVFDTVEALNGALAAYPPDTLNWVSVYAAEDFTKDEVRALTDMFIIPSGNYSMSTGFSPTAQGN